MYGCTFILISKDGFLEEIHSGANLEATLNHSPWLIMTFKNLMITLEHGLIRTWRLPRFSALLMDLRASLNTFMRTILTLWKRIYTWKLKLNKFNNLTTAKPSTVNVGHRGRRSVDVPIAWQVKWKKSSR